MNRTKWTIRDLAFCGLFAALIAVGAFIKITIPVQPVPMHFTLQFFFVLLAGLLLGARRALATVSTYLIIGLCGIPVFASGGGPSYVLRPGFGFLLGFLVAAFVVGKIIEKFKWNKMWQYLIATVIGEIIYYSIGAVYFYLLKNFYVGDTVSWSVVVVEYCLITVLPDFVLCILAVLVTMKVKVPLNHYILERSV